MRYKLMEINYEEAYLKLKGECIERDTEIILLNEHIKQLVDQVTNLKLELEVTKELLLEHELE